MRAVNLIPADQRRGAGGIAGRSGGIVYVVAGGLLVVVAMGIVYAFSVDSVAHRKTQLATVTAQVNSVAAQTAALAPYVQVAGLRQAKVGEVVGLAQARFNWPTAMQQLALALPSDVTLTQLTAAIPSDTGTAVTAATVGPAGPSFTLAGCASSQAEVPTVLSRLARLPHAAEVKLTTAQKSTNAVPNTRKPLAPNAGEAAGGACPNVTFNLTLSYDAKYTVPTQKVPTQSGTQTVSSTPAKKPAARTTSRSTRKVTS